MTINVRTRIILCKIVLLFVFGFLYITVQEVDAREDLDMENDRIQIYKENSRYWQYKGEPILLIGGFR